MTALEKFILEAKKENELNWQVAKIGSEKYLATIEGKNGAKVVRTKCGTELIAY